MFSLSRLFRGHAGDSVAAGRVRGVLLSLTLLLAARLVAMWLIPLNDTTEARYAEIARKMLDTGNWVTLWHDVGVPFWAKPPLSTWLSAVSMGVFGVNAMAVRLPALLLALAMLALVFTLARARLGREAALSATLVLASSVLFLLGAGTVMTDPALLACVTLSLAAFWLAVPMGRRPWGWAFFAGLGLGLLAKGPLAVVLVGMPVFGWVLLRGQWGALWRRLPWLGGSLLTLAIATPWYALAELRTPGFLDYFIMGEHVARFLDAGWKGDRYGFAHATPRGMIWLYAAAALLPWTPLFAWRLLRGGRSTVAAARAAYATADDGWLLYLSLWALTPLAFFSLSGNVIAPYALPMMPGFALLFATLWGRQDGQSRLPAWLATGSALLMLAVCAAFVLRPDAVGRSQREVVAAWQADQPAADSLLWYWDDRREFSAEFYSQGRVRTTDDVARLHAQLSARRHDYLVLDAARLSRLPASLASTLAEVARVNNDRRTWIVLRNKQGGER